MEAQRLAGMEAQGWSLCCSTFEGCDTTAKFHAACDAHAPTLTVAHNAGSDDGSNPGNFTFGGFVRSPLPASCGPWILCVSVPILVPFFVRLLPRFCQTWERSNRVWLASGVANEGRRSPMLLPPFVGPGLGARWNRLGEAVKTRKKGEKRGKNGRDTA